MNSNLLQLISALAIGAPFLVMTAILVYYGLRRAAWKHKNRRRETGSSFCPSSCALGTALLFAQIFYRPTVTYVLEAKLDEDIEQDDQGDPETATKQLNRQLKRIRRGEEVGDLVLRL